MLRTWQALQKADFPIHTDDLANATEGRLTHKYRGPEKRYRRQRQTYPYILRSWQTLQKTDLPIHTDGLTNATENRLTHTYWGPDKRYRKQTYPYILRTWDGLQNPHWVPSWFASLSWMGWRPWVGFPKPSMVVISIPSQAYNSNRHCGHGTMQYHLEHCCCWCLCDYNVFMNYINEQKYFMFGQLHHRRQIKTCILSFYSYGDTALPLARAMEIFCGPFNYIQLVLKWVTPMNLSQTIFWNVSELWFIKI